MAGKEANVYIVDVGMTMNEHGNGRSESNFEYSMKYVWDKLTSTIATGRKTLLAGVIALRSKETNNELGEEAHYDHISVLHDLAQLLMPAFRDLRSQLVAGDENAGDIVSALVIAIQMIAKTCKKLSYQRRIFLITDARAPVTTDDLGEIANKMKEDNIELIVLGVDFDDSEFGFKEEDKDATKAANEEILRQLCQDVNGSFSNISQAVEELEIPRIKQVKPVQSYKGFLSLGDSETYDDAFNINVERYPKTMVAHPPSASSYVIRSNMDSMDEDNLAAVKNARTYQITDQSAPGGKKEVELEELAKGYEYGRTAVHISESDQNVTNFETPQGLDIIGFVDAKHYERYLDMARTNLIVPEKGNDKAAMALSSLIHALKGWDAKDGREDELYAIARFVAKDNRQPLVVLLCPYVDDDFECLYEVELPFAEDLRPYKFPPLDRVVTVSGKSVTMHRLLPSTDLQTAMDAYVDSLDLAEASLDEDGNLCEYMQMDETYSPVLHHLNHVIRQRAIYPDRAPPAPAPILTRYAQQPEHLLGLSKQALDKLIEASNVQKVPPKARGKRSGKQEEKPLSELDIGALLASDPKRKQKKIDPANAVPEFKQLLFSAASANDFPDICKQLQKIISDWIKYSVGDSNYAKVIEAIKVMRREMLDFEEPKLYNDFMQTLKTQLLSEELGGERKDMWFLIRVDKQTALITKRECGVSVLTEEDAAAFKSAR